MNPQLISRDEVRTRLVTLAELVRVLAQDVQKHKLMYGAIQSARRPVDYKKNGHLTQGAMSAKCADSKQVEV